MSRHLEMTKKYIDLLSKQELKQIQAYIQLKNPPKRSNEFSEEEYILIDKLVKFIKHKKLGRLTEKSLTSNKGLKTLISEASAACFMIVPSNMDLPSIEKLHELVLYLAYSDLNSWSDVTINGLLHTCKKAGQLIENNFPGYIEANMLPFLLNNQGHKRGER